MLPWWGMRRRVRVAFFSLRITVAIRHLRAPFPVGCRTCLQDATQGRLYPPNLLETEFSEVRLEEWGLLSGERHRRGAAQGKSPLRGQDDRRVRTLYPPKLRRWPLVYRFLYGRRLDHVAAGVDELGQTRLLLQGSIQVDRPHPVEGGPRRSPLAALLFDEPPKLVGSCSSQGFFLCCHEQPPLLLQALGSEAVSLEVGEQLLF